MTLRPGDSNGEPTEISPLLSKIRAVEPADGITPEGTLAAATLNPMPTLSDQDGFAAGDPGALERQISRRSVENLTKRSEGILEITKGMKYILPAIMAIGIFPSAADQTIIVSSYGKIRRELNALNQTNWIATAYSLTLTSFHPLYGELSGIFGRK